MGREDFTTPPTSSSVGDTGTLAVSERPEVTPVDVSQGDTVKSGGAETVSVFAPSGSNYNLRAAFIQAPGVGASGFHEFIVQTAGKVRILRMVADAGGALRFDNGQIVAANNTRSPQSEAAQQIAVQNARASEEQPLEIRYLNDTDEDQTRERKIRLMFEEVSY